MSFRTNRRTHKIFKVRQIPGLAHDMISFAYKTEILPLNHQVLDFPKIHSDVSEYKRIYRTGGALPMVLVTPIGNGKYRVLDGFHRLMALEELGVKKIEVAVISPEQAEEY